ncbi:MAG: hypothetical protein ACI9VR_003984 [Cognaticolwellia sp.]|jgi:hypothetical protein
MKIVLIAGFGVVALVFLGLLGAAAMQPNGIAVERAVVIDAQPQDIWVHIADYNNFVAWSPSTEKDPKATREISTPAHGLGSTYAWSGNDAVGTGTMETITYQEPTKLEQQLTFTAPLESSSTVFYELTPVEGGTRVRWGFEVHLNLQMKMATLFMDMDEMLGGEYELGLANLGEKAKATAAKRIEDEKQAAQVAAKAEAEAEADVVAN